MLLGHVSVRLLRLRFGPHVVIIVLDVLLQADQLLKSILRDLLVFWEYVKFVFNLD